MGEQPVLGILLASAEPGRVHAALSMAAAGAAVGRRVVLLAAGLVGFTGWAVVSLGRGLLAIGFGALHALWLLPALVALHLLQLLLSARAWRWILPQDLPLRRLFRLRIIREGIDSLLPVAQVGGEVVGAHLLARDSAASLAQAGASVVVDVTLEFLTQLVFLLAGVAALAATSSAGGWQGRW